MVAVVGLGLVVLGVKRWLERREVEDVVEAFMRAMRTGNRDAAAALFDPESPQLKQAGDDETQWTPHPEFDYRIHKLERSGSTAQAEIWIEAGGYVVKPILELRLSETNSWRIMKVINPGADPVWVYDQDRKLLHEQAAQKKADLELAGQLKEALADLPGVEVERVPLRPSND
jgi:hypothetical protein